VPGSGSGSETRTNQFSRSRIAKMDSKGDYQGFGEGFYGFTKSLPDDCVEYSLFVIDAQLNSPREILSRLEIVRKESHKLAESLLKEYIWQRDGFKLDIKEDKGEKQVLRSTRIVLITD
jgi:hypothetical protein